MNRNTGAKPNIVPWLNGATSSGRRILDAVDPVHRRQQQFPDASDEIQWRMDCHKGAWDRAAGGVELVLARRNEERQQPDQDQHEREDRDRRRESCPPSRRSGVRGTVRLRCSVSWSHSSLCPVSIWRTSRTLATVMFKQSPADLDGEIDPPDVCGKAEALRPIPPIGGLEVQCRTCALNFPYWPCKFGTAMMFECLAVGRMRRVCCRACRATKQTMPFTGAAALRDWARCA